MYNFEGQVVIVTGGTRGIGKAISEGFLKSGAKVVAIYANSEESALKMKEENSAYAHNLELIKLDIREEKSVDVFFKYIEDKYGSIHVLVNNSGIRRDSLSATMSVADWKDVIDTNLTGAFHMSKNAILNFLKNRYGRIINISSIGGKICLPGQANYAATKAGIIAMTKSISKEVAKKGITVNSVSPGFIETEFISSLSETQLSEYKQSVPMKRFGKGHEVAEAVMFLATKNASYITGSDIEVSGGL